MTPERYEIILDVLKKHSITVRLNKNNTKSFLYNDTPIGNRKLNKLFLTNENIEENELDETLYRWQIIKRNVEEIQKKQVEVANNIVGSYTDILVLAKKDYYCKSKNGDYSIKTTQQCRNYIEEMFSMIPDFNYDVFIETVNNYYCQNPIDITIPSVAGLPAGININEKLLIETGYHFPRVGETDNCPTFKAFIKAAFKKDPEQEKYIMSWMKRMLMNLKGEDYLRGHILYLVGEKNSCKTLLLNLISFLTGIDKHTDVRDILMDNKSNFNSELFKSTILSCDDKNPPKHTDYSNYASSIKSLAATLNYRWEAKNRDAVTLSPKWRVIFCLNDTAEATMMLPPINSSTQDKVLVLKMIPPHLDEKICGCLKDPADTTDSVFYNELPEIRKYILDYIVPDDIVDDESMRFGFKSYQTPTIEISENVNKKTLEIIDIINEIPQPNVPLVFSSGHFYRYMELSGNLRRSGVKNTLELAHILSDIYKSDEISNLTFYKKGHQNYYKLSLTSEFITNIEEISLKSLCEIADGKTKEDRVSFVQAFKELIKDELI